MIRSSTLAVAMVVTGCSVAAFVAPISRPTVSPWAKSEGMTCNAKRLHHRASGFHRRSRSKVSRISDDDGDDEITLTPTLPQDDDSLTAAERVEQTDLAKKKYEWSLDGPPAGVPYLKDVPDEEHASATWTFLVASEIEKILFGTIGGHLEFGEIYDSLGDQDKLKALAVKIGVMIQNAKGNPRPESLEDYNDMHGYPIKTPDSEYDFDLDQTFARLRLQGNNPVTIERCSQATRDKLKILDDENYAGLKQTVDALMQANKLLVVDQELLEDNTPDPLTSEDGDIPRFLSANIALFEVTEDDLHPIKAIGIQLGQGNGDTATPIFTPTDGYTWTIAKACFEASDFIIHEVLSHLSFTHLMMEGALVGMHRNLATRHPIYVLFHPHLEGTAHINAGAQNLLIPVGGGVDQLLANTIEDCWNLSSDQTVARLGGDFSPEADFSNRFMTKDAFPGRYMYRDYGLLYWEATFTWVKEYLSVYYKDDADIDADTELAAFVEDMVITGKVLWLNDLANSDDKIGFIAKVIASWIYTASTLHAAVNFPQQSIMSYNPSNPGSVYQPMPTNKDQKTFDDYLAYLPPLGIATTQVTIGTLLGSIYYTKLGQYKPTAFLDDRVHGHLQTFHEAIEDIGTKLVLENSELVVAAQAEGKTGKVATNYGYTTLLPDNIPQSINT